MPPASSTPRAEFWLHPADVMRFKAEVMRHLPILIYGDRTKLTESEAGGGEGCTGGLALQVGGLPPHH